MANIKLIIEYDGSDYFGFQKQPDLPTIQGRLEEALRQLVFMESPLYGAGRTDAGVHARGQVVNFKASTRVPVGRLPAALNARLPSDIVVKHSELVPDDFNARFSAVRREYCFYIINTPHQPALGRNYFYHYPLALDDAAVDRAARSLEGTHDFSSFCRVEEGRSYVREVLEASCVRWAGDVVIIRIVANAFAYMMMRMLCGCLLEVGRGRWTAPYLRDVMEARDNSLCAPALPPHGLVLESVAY
jgi:tRNA pseudouridine38-40 synthase